MFVRAAKGELDMREERRERRGRTREEEKECAGEREGRIDEENNLSV